MLQERYPDLAAASTSGSAVAPAPPTEAKEVQEAELTKVTRTCKLAGFGDRAEIVPDLVEWNYGEYEGCRTVDIHKERPDWHLFHDGCPGGESPDDVGLRADRVIQRVRGRRQRAIFPAGIPSLARARGRDGQILHVEHREFKRCEPRTQTVAASHPVVGRHAPRRKLAGSGIPNTEPKQPSATSDMKIFVCNAGSSSLKFSLFDAEDELLLIAPAVRQK